MGKSKKKKQPTVQVKDLAKLVPVTEEAKLLEPTKPTRKASKPKERHSTKLAKALFLKAYASHTGSIRKACIRANISRSALYDWRRDDPEFLAEMDTLDADKVDFAKEGLYHRIKERDTNAIKFYLQAKDPEFKNKTVLEHNIGNITLEDLLDADDAKYATQENTPGTDRGLAQDSE